MLKKVMSIVLSAFFMVSLVACSNNGGTSQEVPSGETKTLKVGMSGNDQTYAYQNEETENITQNLGLTMGIAPYCWIQNDDSNGAVKIENNDKYMNGYDVRIAKKIAEKLNRELVIVEVAWEDLIDKVNNGEIDLIISGMSPIKERKELIDFSDYYYASGFSFVVRNDGSLKNATKLIDFKGSLLASMSNTTAYFLLDTILDVDKVPLDSFSLCEAALITDKVDGFLTEIPIAKLACQRNDSFKSIDVTNQFNLSEDEYSVAVGMKKDSELKSAVNETINSISAEERENLMNEAIQAAL